MIRKYYVLQSTPYSDHDRVDLRPIDTLDLDTDDDSDDSFLEALHEKGLLSRFQVEGCEEGSVDEGILIQGSVSDGFISIYDANPPKEPRLRNCRRKVLVILTAPLHDAILREFPEGFIRDYYNLSEAALDDVPEGIVLH